MRATQGYRRSTRRKLKRGVREKFKPTDYLREFKSGEKVAITITPLSQKGMPFPKFMGKIGTVTERRGNSYLVRIFDGNKEKTIISRPEHLKRL